MANEAMRDNWAVGGEAWVRNERIFDHVFTDITATLLAAADLAGARRVLDVGCGSGALLARAVDAGATAVGVDISEPMVAAARDRVPEAEVVLADAQEADLTAHGPFDRIVSRFGVMFFDDPVAAFTNLRAAAAPGARLAFVCWRDDEHEMFELGLGALRRHLPDGALPAPIVGAPGPLGFGDRSRVEEVLFGAGWGQIAIEPVDVPCDYGVDGSDGVDARLAVALSGSVGRAARAQLEPEVGPEGWDAIVAEMRDELLARRTGGTIQLLAHLWLVSATNPA